MDHTYREIVLTITFIRLWYIFLYLTSLNSSPANSKHIYSRQLNSTLTCAKCSRIDVLIVTPGKDKGRRDASQKYHKHFMSGAVEFFRSNSWLRFILKPSLRSPVLDTVLLSNPDLLDLFTWEKRGEASDGQLLSKIRVSPSKRGACPWRSMELETVPGQVKAGL